MSETPGHNGHTPEEVASMLSESFRYERSHSTSILPLARETLSADEELRTKLLLHTEQLTEGLITTFDKKVRDWHAITVVIPELAYAPPHKVCAAFSKALSEGISAQLGTDKPLLRNCYSPEAQARIAGLLRHAE